MYFQLSSLIVLLSSNFLTAVTSFGKVNYTRSSHPDCHLDIKLLWSEEVTSSPIIAAPLIIDINNDDDLDVIVASHSNIITVLHGSNGSSLSGWPVVMPHKHFLAAPLFHDVGRDGILEVVIVDSDGFIHVLDKFAQLVAEYKFPKLYVSKSWHEENLVVDHMDINRYVKTSSGEGDYIPLDAHILSNVIITDLNQDGIREELVAAVSYYLDKDIYSLDEHKDLLREFDLDLNDLDKYLVSSLVVINVTNSRSLLLKPLELTKVHTYNPAYTLSPPTVIILDPVITSHTATFLSPSSSMSSSSSSAAASSTSSSPHMSIAMATSMGYVHVLDGVSGEERRGFPIQLSDPIHSQVVPVIVRSKVHLLVADTSGTVHCYSTSLPRHQRNHDDAAGNSDATLVWETETSTSSVTGMRLIDVDGDGEMDVVMVGDDGSVWALQTSDGKVLKNFPKHFPSHSFLTNLLPSNLYSHHSSTLIFGSYQGSLHFLTPHLSTSTLEECEEVLTFTDGLISPPLSAHLIHNDEGGDDGVEIVVATMGGVVSALRVSRQRGGAAGVEWRGENGRDGVSHAAYGRKQGVEIIRDELLHDVEGSYFTVSFLAHLEKLDSSPYTVQVKLGELKISGVTSHITSGHIYTLHCIVPTVPMETILSLQLHDKYGNIYTDEMAVRFHMRTVNLLHWSLLIPFMITVTILLFLHAFPESHLLPTLAGKHK